MQRLSLNWIQLKLHGLTEIEIKCYVFLCLLRVWCFLSVGLKSSAAPLTICKITSVNAITKIEVVNEQ